MGDGQNENKPGISGLFRQFTKQFWIVNTLELFERGAFYALMAVLAQHMVQNLQFSETLTGIIAALFMFCLYFLPFILGAIADKFGFKQMLILNFILMCIGYSLMGVASDTTLFVISIVILGVGAGGFKPIISTTIAEITHTEQRSLAYTIYYWMINCGAFFFPLIFGIYFAGFPSPEAAAPFYRYIFFFSAFFVIVNLTITLLFYNNPKAPESEKKLTTIFANAMTVVKDRKFFALLIIYSGFWFMFAMNHTYLPLYMLNFKIMPGWFTTLLLATINPGTIIIMGPFLAKYQEKLPSLQMMIMGLGIFMVGLFILGISPTPAALFLGIIIFSIGEFITHPNFISYVSKIAPPEQRTIYMGYIFIATGNGLVLGTLFGGALYESVARNMESPRLFWAIIISIGLVSAFLFLLYNRKYGEEKPSEDLVSVEPEKALAIRKRILESNITLIVPILVIPIIIFAAFSAGTVPFHELKRDTEEDISEKILEEIVIPGTEPGYTNENQVSEFTFVISEETPKLVWVNCSLSWTDEDSAYPFGTNDPDEFQVSIIAPNGETMDDSGFSNAGTVEATVKLDFEEADFQYNYLGEWTVQVEAGVCGDDSSAASIIGVILTTEDTGNDWSLDYSYTYLSEQEES
ncbi:MAG: MFS transporter [Thermoplasmata archaeon]|nr:MFS transporter [Thermoplasmata archaeon]